MSVVPFLLGFIIGLIAWVIILVVSLYGLLRHVLSPKELNGLVKELRMALRAFVRHNK